MFRLLGVTHDESLVVRNGDMLREACRVLHALSALDTNGALTPKYGIWVTHAVL